MVSKYMEILKKNCDTFIIINENQLLRGRNIIWSSTWPSRSLMKNMNEVGNNKNMLVR